MEEDERKIANEFIEKIKEQSASVLIPIDCYRNAEIVNKQINQII